MNNNYWALSIDFGTANSTAAHMAGTGTPVVLEVEGSRYLPSVVFVDKSGQFLTGKAAVQKAATAPERAVRAPKRALVAGEKVVLEGQSIEVADLIAAVLKQLYGEAVRFHGGQPPDRVVLTHPARWGEVLTGRLREAAARAGIADPQLEPEPVAAAWWYAPPEPGHVVGVFDLGGGTLDTAMLSAQNGTFALAGPPGGDGELGGEDFDELLLERVSEQARDRDEAAWRELFTAEDQRARRDRWRLRQDVVIAKEALSQHSAFDLAVGDYKEEFRVTRPEFEELISPVLDTAAGEMRTTIGLAGLEAAQLTALYLTGGASRVPAVATRLATVLGIMPQMKDDPKAVVALGALKMLAEVTRPDPQDAAPGDGKVPAALRVDDERHVISDSTTTAPPPTGTPPIAVTGFPVLTEHLQSSAPLTGNVVVERVAVQEGSWVKIGDPLFMLRSDTGTVVLWSTFIGEVQALGCQTGQPLAADRPLLTLGVSGWLFRPNVGPPFATGVLLATSAPARQLDATGAASRLLVTIDKAGSRPVPWGCTSLLYVPEGMHVLAATYELSGSIFGSTSQVVMIRTGRCVVLAYDPPRAAGGTGKLRS